MKKFTKALVMSLGIAAVAGAFAPNAGAQSLPPPPCATCSLWSLSPDAGALAFGDTIAITGGNLTFTSATLQAPGTYGAGFTVGAPGGSTINFDADLYSFDSTSFDNFIVTLSTAGYYWSTGLGSAVWSWGGANFPGLEEYHTAVGGFDTLSQSASGPLYVSFVMKTTSDSLYASQGSFHVEVAAIPEPETYAMLLAGLGLMGFVARRRQRKLAAA